MTNQLLPVLIACLAVFSLAPAFASDEAFHAGKTITGFGRVATVESDMPIPDQTEFKVVFDIAKPAEAGTLNRGFDSAARFINMHMENGVPLDRIKISLVIHGPASNDLLVNEVYKTRISTDNASASLIQILVNNGVEIYLCGQSAAYFDVQKKDLVPGVKVVLSAMTAHALLQQNGYTLNPF